MEDVYYEYLIRCETGMCPPNVMKVIKFSCGKALGYRLNSLANVDRLENDLSLEYNATITLIDFKFLRKVCTNKEGAH